MTLSVRTRMFLKEINEKHLQAIEAHSKELQLLLRAGFGGNYPKFEPTKYAALLNAINANIRLIEGDLHSLSKCDDEEKKEVMKHCAAIIEKVNNVYDHISQLYNFLLLSPLESVQKKSRTVCTPAAHLTYLGAFTKGYQKLKNSGKVVEQNTKRCLTILHAINEYRMAVMENKNNASSIKINIENLVDQFIQQIKNAHTLNDSNENIEEIKKLLEILLVKFKLMDAFAKISDNEEFLVDKLKNLSEPSVSKLNSFLEFIQNNWKSKEKSEPTYRELKEEDVEEPIELEEKVEQAEYQQIRSLR